MVMKQDEMGIARREFLGSGLALGAGALLSGMASTASAAAPVKKPVAPAKTPAEPLPPMPTATFGRSGVKVSRIALGTVFDTGTSQLVFERAWKLGVRYWDTADCYLGGRSEQGIGRYFGRHPARRKDIFLVTASDARDPVGMERLLSRSLKRMKTRHIDLFLVHGVKHVEELNKGSRAFAAKAKADGRIKMFGFSTHKNCTPLLAAAAKMPWIDGILATWNYETMKDARAQAAVQACYDAGIGLTAMKVNRCAPPNPNEKRDRELVIRHMEAGYSLEQARLLAVLGDRRIASVALTLKNIGLVNQYAAAALGRPKLPGV